MPGENEELNQEEIAAIESVEKEAKEMGWLPKERFKGPEDKWVPADEFVDKAQHVIPIMRANNERLRKDLLTRDGKIGTLQQELENVRSGLGVMEKHYKEQLQRGIAAERTRLEGAYRTAREDNDVDAELQVQKDLKNLDKSEAELAEVKIVPDKKVDPKDGDFEKGLTPDYKAWEAENPWFNVDKKRTRLITLIAEDLAREEPNLKGRAFFDECSKRLEEEHPSEETPRRRQESKVEGGATRGSRSNGKSFSDLPADAKQACHSDLEVLVGEGKLFKTKAEWEKHYAETYFADGA